MLSSLLLAVSVSRSDGLNSHHFDIAAQSLSSALNEFAHQSQEQILFAPVYVAQKSSSPVRGDMPWPAALKVLLKDSGLTFKTTANGTILVGNPVAPPPVSNDVRASQVTPPMAGDDVPEALDTVVVEGAKDREKSLRRQVNNYVSAVALASQGKYMARWARDAPLCPLVTGLNHDDANKVLHRILQIATSVGVPAAGEDCTPNLHVVVTSQPDEMLKEWIKHDPQMFDSQIDDGGRKIRAFLSASSPVRSWYNVAFKGFGALEYIPGTPAAFLPGATRPGVGIHRDLWSVIVVVDARSAQAVSFDQLAGYIAMVGLAQIRADAKLDEVPTILRLFSDTNAPAGLSSWDWAYLKGLYNAERSGAPEQFAVRESMAREVAR